MACSSPSGEPGWTVDGEGEFAIAAESGGDLFVQWVRGSHGSNATYEVYRPRLLWNGRLVVYAHGYVDPERPLALPNASFDPEVNAALELLRDTLLERGFGFAWTSRDHTGYAVKSGIARTDELREIFVNAFRRSNLQYTYVLGHSLGGLITSALAEDTKLTGRGRQAKLRYSGGLPMCGPLGGGLAQVTYIGDARVLFDHFYPGVMAGVGSEDVITIDEPLLSFDEVVAAVAEALAGDDGAGAAAQAAFDQVRLPYSNPDELLSSVLGPLYFNYRGGNDLMNLAGGSPYDNQGTVYTVSGAVDSEVNAAVGRFGPGDGKFSAGAVDYVTAWFTPPGVLQVPVITLSTTQDPDVPLWLHGPLYASAVAAAGKSDLLHQSEEDVYGHCTMSAESTGAAFEALVAWAEAGTAPSVAALAEPRPLGSSGVPVGRSR
jgi:pimeloyl-ACP methyl ester carboxylesterase